MTLRKDIKPEDLANHLTEMPMPRSVGVQVLDATRTREDYQNDVLALRQRFGETVFNDMVKKANQAASAFEQRREAAQAAKNAEIPEPNPLLSYARALASNDPLAKEAFLKSQTTETLTEILTEINKNPRHYNSIFNYQVTYAIETLRYHLAQQPKPTLAEKIRNRLGA